jgi:hypothetical protein
MSSAHHKKTVLRVESMSAPPSRRQFLTSCAGVCALCGMGIPVTVSGAPFPPYPKGPKEALHYEKLDGGTVRCGVCARRCVIEDGGRGFCSTRENRGGTL